MSETHNPEGFTALKLSPGTLRQIARMNITTPTPIQEAAIPAALDGRDVVGIAQTGTGKTFAFGLPMVERLQQGEVGLILAPTRELAQQIREALRPFESRSALLIGGAPMGPQIHQLKARPAIIVATPGRLMDHLERRTLNLSRVAIVVLDEADRMLDMGFAPAIRRILEQTPKSRQTLLFSATMPTQIAELSEQFLRNPLRIELEKPGTIAKDVEQELVMVPQAEKSAMLGGLLSEHRGTILVFARTRHGARKLATFVRKEGHTAAEIHSDRSLAQRRQALDGFKRGAFRVLVATDIAARGIDVKDISLVINYDVPENPEDYIHRIGRTGRAGASGRAITIATPEQRRDVHDIEKLLRTQFEASPRSSVALERPRTGVSKQRFHSPRNATRRFRPGR